MKGSRKAYLPVAIILAVAATWGCLFTGPHWFTDYPVNPQSLDHLAAINQRSAHSGQSPFDVADEYLHWWCVPSDRPKRSGFTTSVDYRSPDTVVVTIIRSCQDDSIYRLCDRVTLVRRDGAWIPNRHQAAWQGRGRIGWTTAPTS